MASRARPIVVLALLSAAGVAEAQPALVVPTSARRPAWQLGRVQEQAHALRAAMRAAGVRVYDLPTAVGRFRELGVREVRAPSDRDRRRLADCHEAALEHVASGHRRRTVTTVEDCLTLLRPAVLAMLRDEALAERLLDLCLFRLRAVLEGPRSEGGADAASAQALRCLRLVPGVRPGAELHPSTVRDLYARVARERRSGATGSVEVWARREGCAVYVDGRRRGETPATVSGLPMGVHEVQVECDRSRPARYAHRVEVGASGPARLELDRLREVALFALPEEGGGLPPGYGYFGLAYELPSEEARWRYEDALALGRRIGSSEVWLLGVPDLEARGVVRLDRVRTTDGEVLASVLTPAPFFGGELGRAREAVAALRAGRSVDLRGAQPRPIAAWEPPR